MTPAAAPVDVVAVGFGGIGTQDHQSSMYLPALAAHPSFRIAGVADAAGTRGAAKAAGEYGVPHLPDLDAAFAAAPVVSVAVPLADRAEVVGAAIRAGRHVLADKPLAATAEEAAELAALAARHGVAVVPAHHLRLGGALRTARAAVRGGRVGLPWNVQGDMFVAGGDPAPTGELVNLALYPIDAVLALLDLPVRRVHAIGGPDVVTVLLDLANDVTATVACGRTGAVGGLAESGIAVHRYRISGSHGVLAVDATRPALRLRNSAGQQRAWTGPSTVDALLDALATAVRTGRADPGPDDAVRVQRVVDAARRALETGAPVDISDPRE